MPNPSLSKIKLNGVEYELEDAIARQGLDNIYIINVTLTSLTEGTSDKTHTEILNAVNTGKIPFVKTSFSGANMLAPLTHINSNYVIFTYINQLDDNVTIKYAQMKITDNIVTLQILNNNFASSAQIPTLTSELTNDSGFITSESDPIFRSSAAASITQQDIDGWNNIITSSYVISFNGQSGDITYTAPVTSVNGKTGVVDLDANDVGALPNDTPIPTAVTEQTVSDWGFTKNTGTYSKPVSGIPDSDIASAEIWNAKGTYSKPSDGIPASDLAAGVIPDISGKANAADVYTKTEVDQKLVGAMDYKGTKATVSALPTSGNETGDVWHITADGSEWAWNGSAWEELGSAVDLSGYRTASAQDTIDAAQDSAIAAKYTKPSGGIPKSDLASTVQTSLGKADTALQSVPSGYATETWVTNKGYGTYSKPTSGIPKSDLASAVQTSLGKADTALQVAPVSSVNGKTGAVVLDANDVGALPSNTPIPSAVTEQTVSDWGFTKNTGTYSKPSSGIPKSDLSSAVQTSLGKADTALQSVPSTYRTATAQDIIDAAQDTAIAAKYTKPSDGIPDSDIASAATWNAKGTYSKPNGGIPKTDLASAVQTSLGKADTALQQHQSLAGYATETYVQQQIANISNELPSGGSTGDFLCKTANGVAWQTIPSAESSSFGGGN